MMRSLKIGYLIPQFPGQTHVFFWRELRALDELGVDVTVFSTRQPPSGLISHDWSEEAISRTLYLGEIKPMAALAALSKLPKMEGLSAVRRDGVPFAKDLAICLAAARRLVKECQRLGITHVHVHSCGRAALIAAIANRTDGLAYSLTLHGPLSDYGCGQPYKWRNAAFATVITHKLADELPDQLGPDLPARISIQPMGVDTDDFRRVLPYEPYTGGRPLRIFCCARLNVVKGHQDLMQAVRILCDQGIDVHLEIAGEDDAGGSGFRSELEELRVRLHLEENVSLLGAISSDVVKSKLFAADMFVLASWHEPLGVAYMEAMSAGVPTIATNTGGVPELITDEKNGILVPPKNPAVLAQAIKRLASDQTLAVKLSAAGRSHIKAKFRSQLGAETLVREIRNAASRS